MTPQERQLVSDLFGRLASLENSPRDPDAERMIRDGLGRAPNALYALVQTVLVQDEALKRADARIQELESGGAPQQAQSGGFLDSMREAFTGRSGSVPNAGGRFGQGFQGNAAQNPQTQNPQAQNAQAPGERGGGSFLGTAAAAAAGVIGGSLLMNSIGSMFGHRGQAFAGEDAARGGQSPWGGDNNSNSDLSREAGVNDIDRGGQDDSQRAGLFDDNQNNADDGNDNGDFDLADSGGDFGGDDSA